MARFRVDAYIEDNGAENTFSANTQEEAEDMVIEWVREEYSEVYGGEPFVVTVNVVVEEDQGATWEPVWEGDMNVYVEPQDE